MTIGVGVIGLGFMGRRYARFLSQMGGLKLAGVCDIRSQLRDETARQFNCRAFSTYQELTDSSEVAAVVVCTPEHLHVEPVLAALEAGKPVLVEKPVAHSLGAARKIATVANARAGLVLVGHLLRFEPRWIAAKRMIDAGEIGEVVSLTTRRVGNVRDQEVLRGRTTIPLYYGVHDLDVLRWFAGSEPTRIYADRRFGVLREAGFDVEDLYYAIINFENGTLAMAELGWHVPPGAAAARTSGVTVVGTRGVICVEQGQTGIDAWSDGGCLPTDTTFWPEAYDVPGGALSLEIRHFADCIRKDSAPAISLDDSIEALRLSLAMQLSAESGLPVNLKEFGRS